MSSKSRKHSSPPARKNTGQAALPPGGGDGGQPPAGAAAGELDPQEPSAQDFLEAEELLKTPKGKNPLVYAFLIFLLIFLLIVFILPPDVLNGGGDRQDPEALSWKHPTLGQQVLRQSDLMREANAYAQIFEVATGRRPELDLEQIASFVVLDALAIEHGVTVSDAELAKQLGQIVRNYGTSQNFQRRVDGLPGSGGVLGFQENLRRFLRAERFRQLISYLGSLPAAEDLRKAWEESYPEFAFEALSVEIAAQADAARAALPDDAGLEAWWNQRPEVERRALYSPEKRSASLAAIPLPSDPAVPASFDSAALAAAFPLPEGWDPEVEGDGYYKRNYFRRFKLAAPNPEAPEQLYAPYETVKAQAALEAALQQHLTQLLESLRTRRAAGETLELGVEAGRFGLLVLADGQARSDQEWRELPDLGGDYLLGQLRALSEPGALVGSPVVERSALLLAELVQRVEPAAPPFAEIRGQVEQRWLADKQKELARAALESLSAELLPPLAEGELAPLEPRIVSAEAFAAAAAARGLSVAARDFLPREHGASEDPQFEDPLHSFLRTHAPVYSLAEGALGEVVETLDQTRFVLVRAAGKRPLPIAKMKAKQWDSLYQQNLARAQFEFSSEGPLSFEALKRDFGLVLVDPRREGPGAPTAPGAEAGAPEAGAPEAGAPEAGAPEAGAPEAGAPEAGAPEAGAEAQAPESPPAGS
jgi:hypothetical protein